MKVWNFFKRHFISFIRMLPIFTGLPDLQLKHHAEAVKEVFVTVLFSTMPLWAGAFFTMLLDVGASVNGFDGMMHLYLANLNKISANGVLFLYSASLVAPIFMMSVVAKPRAQESTRLFPGQRSHIIFVFIVNVLASGIYGLQLSDKPFNPYILNYTAAVTAVMALIVLYVATAYKQWTIDPAEEMRSGELEWRTEYGSHRAQRS